MKMPIKSVATGLVFVHNEEVYLKTNEMPGFYGCLAANISTGKLTSFNQDLVVELTEFEYSYDINLKGR